MNQLMGQRPWRWAFVVLLTIPALLNGFYFFQTEASQYKYMVTLFLFFEAGRLSPISKHTYCDATHLLLSLEILRGTMKMYL
jgi:hypothetical protein